VRACALLALLPACFQPPDFGPGGDQFVNFQQTAFQRGCVPDGEVTCPGDATPQTTVVVVAFAMQRAEVTQGEYDACVQRGECTVPAVGYDPVGAPDLPVRGVPYHDALRFCEHVAFTGTDGTLQLGRLPSEAEWECAAGLCNPGAVYPWMYPWGNVAPACAFANAPGCAGGVVPASAATATARGLLDMAGNLREWVLDVYTTPYSADLESPCFRCDEDPPDRRVTRGGSFREDASKLRVWARAAEDPASLDDAHIGDVGFRCAAQ